ncbi:MAG: alcohol dehydrogenase [Acidimicrobiaceae bacterium]|jgi:NAD(P)-dependent dehydrogenase (short-subunit alcohol dehydrogenase family)|nr:alcohol dehydrogenase [Acidimicrobiaceae bacterium]|tara:strand:- start:4727 stop:5494 length:768 start_codon:yes stop_codon:yes gene_type:complete
MGELKESKVAIVTGAASGIGASLTRHLIDNNHHVLGVDINPTKLDALKEDTGCATIVGDIASEEFNQAMASHANELFGRLDHVFLNAGILGRNIELQGTEFKIKDLEHARYQKTRSINFDAVVFGTSATSPYLTSTGGGSIVVTASIAGLTAWNRDPFYTATKHAAVGWVRGIAPALQSQKVSINAICPGGVATPLVGLERLESDNPNLLNPEEVAHAILDIAQGNSTGKAFVIKAGQEPLTQVYDFTAIEGFPV